MVQSSMHWAQGLGKLFLQLIQAVWQNKTDESVYGLEEGTNTP